MKKNKKDLRKEIVKALEGKRKFVLSWAEITQKDTIVEAKDEEEAREMFFNDDIDWDKVDIGNTDYEEDSLCIEEVEE